MSRNRIDLIYDLMMLRGGRALETDSLEKNRIMPPSLVSREGDAELRSFTRYTLIPHAEEEVSGTKAR
jgi:hypothetical protein